MAETKFDKKVFDKIKKLPNIEIIFSDSCDDKVIHF